MNPVIHFEIPADDADRAHAFYEAAFGWRIDAVPGMPYRLLGTTAVDPETRRPTAPGSINGGMLTRTDAIQHPVITIGVDDMAAALARVGAAGGEVIVPPFAVGDLGTSAYVRDTEGNVVGVWKSAS